MALIYTVKLLIEALALNMFPLPRLLLETRLLLKQCRHIKLFLH